MAVKTKTRGTAALLLLLLLLEVDPCAGVEPEAEQCATTVVLGDNQTGFSSSEEFFGNLDRNNDGKLAAEEIRNVRRRLSSLRCAME
jgi:hypothetical protein